MRAGFNPKAVTVANKTPHVVRAVFIAARHCARQRIDHDQLERRFLRQVTNALKQKSDVSVCPTQIDRFGDDVERHAIGFDTVIQAISREPFQYTEPAFGRDVDYSALANLPTAPFGAESDAGG